MHRIIGNHRRGFGYVAPRRRVSPKLASASRRDAATTTLRGFTLVELVIVLFIFSILATAAAPTYRSALGSFRADATAKRLAADLEMARRQAKRTSVDQTVEFDVDDGLYVFIDMPDLDHPSQDYEVRLDDPAYNAMLMSADFNGDSEVTFNMYGQPDNAGTVTIQSGTFQRQIDVDANGAITLP